MDADLSSLDGRFTIRTTAEGAVLELKSAVAGAGAGAGAVSGAGKGNSKGKGGGKGKGKGASKGFTNTRFGAHNYPTTRPSDHVDTLHGVRVPDPYRWLEDPDSAETQDWVARQNRCTRHVLDACELQPAILKRFNEVYNYEKLSVPFPKGDRFFVFKKDGLQNQSVLWMANSAEGLYTDEAEVLLDLNAEREDGTLALRTYSFSKDGSLFAYGLSDGGSDWVTIHVKDVATGKKLPDVIPWVKFSGITWLHDNSGFFFARFPVPATMLANPDLEKSAGTETDSNENQMLYFHKMGTSPTDDVVVMKDPEHPKWRFGTDISDDGKILFISTDDSCDPVNRLEYVNLDQETLSSGSFNVITVVDNFDAGYTFLANNGRKVFFKTNLNAPRNRIVSVVLPEAGSATESDKAAMAALKWKEELPQQRSVLKWAQVFAGDRVLTCYLEDVAAKVVMYDLNNLRSPGIELKLPTLGSVSGLSAQRENDDMFLQFTSYLYPGSVLHYKYDPAFTGEHLLATFKETKVPGFDASEFVTFRKFATSKDGTKIPLFVTIAKSTLARGGPCPTLMYGYGGFNISIDPGFSALRLVWLKELGGCYVVANIRGGGEYGDEWHDAGKLFKKQNCFDDFCASGEFLISQGIATKEQLAIYGGSNGGLLVLACAEQRPDLFAAGVSAVPVGDMLRFHKFTIGHAWCSDYGCADGSKAELENLLSYSPLHNVRAPKPGQPQLPALMVTTGDHDDRVVPLHSLKVVATLQEVAGRSPFQRNPLVVRIDVKAGHGAGKPTAMVLKEYSEVYAFFAKYTGASWRL